MTMAVLLSPLIYLSRNQIEKYVGARRGRQDASCKAEAGGVTPIGFKRMHLRLMGLREPWRFVRPPDSRSGACSGWDSGLVPAIYLF